MLVGFGYYTEFSGSILLIFDVCVSNRIFLFNTFSQYLPGSVIMSSTSKFGRRSFMRRLAGVSAAAGTLLAGKLSATEFVKNRHGERMIERYPEFVDARSKKVMFVAHCIINQNARINSCAYTPAAIPKITECLQEREIGIIQMACPELGCLGLGRGGPEEIYDQLSTPGARRYLRGLAESVVYQTKQYQKQGFRVLGVLGIDGSMGPQAAVWT